MGKHLPIALRYHGGKSKIAECFNVLYTYFTKKAKKQIPYQIKRENIELKRAMRRLLNNTDELDRLKEQNTAYYEENVELKRHLQKIKNIIENN